MKILITGSEGFIGKWLVERLRDEGHLVYEADKKSAGNAARWNFVLEYKDKDIDYIFHLAGMCSTSRSLTNPREAFKDNTVTTVNVMEVARHTKARVIFTSTCKTEVGPDGAMTPYGASKMMSELWVKEYWYSYGVPVVINKPGTIYGPGQESSAESGWLGWFIKASITGDEITINGDGKQSRDVLYVHDYVDLLMDQLHNFDKYKNQVFNVGGGARNELTLLRALKVLGYKNFKHGPVRKGDLRRFVSDNFHVSRANGWKPTTSYIEGMMITKDYYEDLLS